MRARETKEKDLFQRGMVEAFVRGFLLSGEKSLSFPENKMGGRACGRALESSVLLICGNSERQKPRTSRDKQNGRLGLAGIYSSVLDRKAAGAVAAGSPCRYLCQDVGCLPQQCVSHPDSRNKVTLGRRQENLKFLPC